MNFIRDFLKKFFRSKLAWAVLGIWILHSAAYELLVHFSKGREIWLVHTGLDDSIPFIEWFIFPYVFWYVWLLAAYLWSFWKSERLFVRLAAMGFSCNAVSMICALIVPNGLPLSMRPDFAALGRSNPATWIVKLLYEIDTPPRVVMPSMHCSICVVLAVFFLTAPPLKKKWGVKIASVILAVTIILSTVFVKQHSVLDLFFGVLTGAAVCGIVFLCEYLFDRALAKKSAVKKGEETCSRT